MSIGSILEQEAEEYLKSCPVCNEKKFSEVYNIGAVYNDPKRTVPLKTQVCYRCGLLFTNPRLKESILESFYLNEMGGLHGIISIEQILEQKPKELTKVRIGFLNKWKQERSKMLEIGGGSLTFAVSLIKEDDRITIDEIDPSLPFNQLISENLNLVKNFFSAAALEDLTAPYDIVTCFHVLEHQYHPEEFLYTIKKILKSDGLLYLEVPYPFSPFWMRKPINGCFRTVHPLNFTRHSLSVLLNKVGFTPLEFDMSSYTMIRLIAKIGDSSAKVKSLSNIDVKRIKMYLFFWKIYSRIFELPGMSKPARFFARIIWHLNSSINKI